MRCAFLQSREHLRRHGLHERDWIQQDERCYKLGDD